MSVTDQDLGRFLVLGLQYRLTSSPSPVWNHSIKPEPRMPCPRVPTNMKIQEPHEHSVLEPASQRHSCGRMALVRGGAVAASSETLLSLLIEEFRAQSLPAT